MANRTASGNFTFQGTYNQRQESNQIVDVNMVDFVLKD